MQTLPHNVIFHLEKSKIIDQIEISLQDHVSKKHILEDATIQLALSPKNLFSIVSRKHTLDTFIPIKIYFTKYNGLFSIEIEGNILLEFSTIWQIANQWKISTKTTLTHHSWISPPEIKLGNIDIPIQKITNFIIQLSKEEFCRSIDQLISQWTNDMTWINALFNKMGEGYSIRDTQLKAYPHINQIHIQTILDKEEEILVSIAADIKIALSDDNPPRTSAQVLPLVTAFETDIPPLPIAIHGDMSYTHLALLIRHKIEEINVGQKNIQVDKINITHTNNLNIVIGISEPITAQIDLNAMVFLDKPLQKIHLTYENITVQPNNFIYKMAAPLIKKAIMSKLNEFNKIDIQNFILPLIETLMGKTIDFQGLRINITGSKIDLTSLSCKDTFIQGSCQIYDTQVDIAFLSEANLI